jgi:hypothetical protein
MRMKDDPENGYRDKIIPTIIAMSITSDQISNQEVINISYLIDAYIKQGIIKGFVTIFNQEDKYL